MVTITDILNKANEVGFFSYVLPFMLIFAVIFAILQKTKIFGDSTKEPNVKMINIIVAISIALLSLLNDFVSTFFATLFPRFGIIIAIFVVILILMGFFLGEEGLKKATWIGWVLLAVVLYWTIDQWSFFGGSFGGWNLQWFIEEYLWGVLILGGVGFLIYKMTK